MLVLPTTQSCVGGFHLICVDPRWTLPAQFADLVRSTKPPWSALTYGVLNGSTLRYHFLIWESKTKRFLTNALTCMPIMSSSPVALPERQTVHFKHWCSPLSCAVYFPSSHSWHWPRCPAVVQRFFTCVPDTKALNYNPEFSLYCTSSAT